MLTGRRPTAAPPNFVGYTLEEDLNLPRTQAALADGIYDVAYVEFIFRAVNHNGYDIVCFQDVAALNGEARPWAYLSLVYNNASVPS